MSRQRDVFPLPRIDNDFLHGRHVVCHNVNCRRLRRSHALEWANAAVMSLNEMAGFSEPSAQGVQHSEVVRDGMASLCDVYCGMDKMPPELVGEDGARDAFSSLLASCSFYGHERQDLASYKRQSLSWPQLSSSPVPLAEHLAGADRDLLRGWKDSLCRKPADARAVRDAAGLGKPYCDPALFSNSQEYASFFVWHARTGDG